MISQILLSKYLHKLNPPSTTKNLGDKKYANIAATRKQIKKDTSPNIAPWTINGARTNQLDAPTIFIVLISSFEFWMANLIVLNTTNTATVIKIIAKTRPKAPTSLVMENTLSMISFFCE